MRGKAILFPGRVRECCCSDQYPCCVRHIIAAQGREVFLQGINVEVEVLVVDGSVEESLGLVGTEKGGACPLRLR